MEDIHRLKAAARQSLAAPLHGLGLDAAAHSDSEQPPASAPSPIPLPVSAMQFLQHLLDPESAYSMSLMPCPMNCTLDEPLALNGSWSKMAADELGAAPVSENTDAISVPEFVTLRSLEEHGSLFRFVPAPVSSKHQAASRKLLLVVLECTEHVLVRKRGDVKRRMWLTKGLHLSPRLHAAAVWRLVPCSPASMTFSEDALGRAGGRTGSLTGTGGPATMSMRLRLVLEGGNNGNRDNADDSDERPTTASASASATASAAVTATPAPLMLGAILPTGAENARVAVYSISEYLEHQKHCGEQEQRNLQRRQRRVGGGTAAGVGGSVDTTAAPTGTTVADASVEVAADERSAGAAGAAGAAVVGAAKEEDRVFIDWDCVVNMGADTAGTKSTAHSYPIH
jgi:hypothetical protein